MHFVFLPANNGINAQATSDHCNLQTKGSTTFFFSFPENLEHTLPMLLKIFEKKIFEILTHVSHLRGIAHFTKNYGASISSDAIMFVHT
jgi:hypothetical protein